MTKKEKELVFNLVYYSKAIANGHNGIKELLRDAIKKVEPLLKK